MSEAAAALTTVVAMKYLVKEVTFGFLHLSAAVGEVVRRMVPAQSGNHSEKQVIIEKSNFQMEESETRRNES